SRCATNGSVIRSRWAVQTSDERWQRVVPPGPHPGREEGHLIHRDEHHTDHSPHSRHRIMARTRRPTLRDEGPPPHSGWDKIEDYATLQKYVESFLASNTTRCLLISGRPGVGKSRIVGDAVRAFDSAAYVQLGGTLSAFGLYIEAFRHRGHPLVVDDV